MTEAFKWNFSLLKCLFKKFHVAVCWRKVLFWCKKKIVITIRYIKYNYNFSLNNAQISNPSSARCSGICKEHSAAYFYSGTSPGREERGRAQPVQRAIAMSREVGETHGRLRWTELTESQSGEKRLPSAFPCDRRFRGVGVWLCDRLSCDSEGVKCFFYFFFHSRTITCLVFTLLLIRYHSSTICKMTVYHLLLQAACHLCYSTLQQLLKPTNITGNLSSI